MINAPWKSARDNAGRGCHGREPGVALVWRQALARGCSPLGDLTLCLRCSGVDFGKADRAERSVSWDMHLVQAQPLSPPWHLSAAHRTWGQQPGEAASGQRSPPHRRLPDPRWVLRASPARAGAPRTGGGLFRVISRSPAGLMSPVHFWVLQQHICNRFIYSLIGKTEG